MPVPSTLADLSVTAASNSPSGADAPSVLDDHLRAHASFLAYLRNSQQLTTEATVASAATVDLGAQTSYAVHITGTTNISSFGSSYQGFRFLRFSGALTLVHNGSSLILPGNANITTAAGDSAIAVPYASGWRVIHYQRASGNSGPAFGAYQSVAQSIAHNTTSKVILQAEEFDTAGSFDSATNYRFQPKVAGYYQISGAVSFSTPTFIYVSIFKNGSEFKRGVQSNVALYTAAVSALIYMNGSTDYLELYGYQGSGGPLDTIATSFQTYFQGSFARAA